MKSGLVLMLSIFVITMSFTAFSRNIFVSDQDTYGVWKPDPYIEAGWTAYTIVSQETHGIRWVGYEKSPCSDDDGCPELLPDQCPDGDCKFTKNVRYYIRHKGERSALPRPLGTGYFYDNGPDEEGTITHNSGAHVARYFETEVQSRARFDETQTQTFTSFDKSGADYDLGHIEEMDAPRTYTQPESVFRYVDGDPDKPEFLTTVVERIGWNDDLGKESFRMSTTWCPVDVFKEHGNSLVKKAQSRTFQFKSCTKKNMPIISNVDNGPFASASQGITGRADSDVTVKPIEQSNGVSLQYEVESDKDNFCSSDCDGTDYMVWTKYNRKNFRVGYINSDRFSSMENESIDGYENFPKGKLITVNPDLKKRKYKGISDTDDWIQSGVEGDKGVVALIVYEKHGEMLTNLDGNHCDRVKDGIYYVYENRALEGADDIVIAKNCRTAKSYTLYTHILFPPRMRLQGRDLTLDQMKDLLDRFLAVMPDQTQTSPELWAAEEFLDHIFALEGTSKCKDPKVVDFPLLVDIGTEEDHLTAQRKMFEFFAQVGTINTPHLNPYKSRFECTPAESAPTQVPESEGTEDEEI